MQLLAEALDSLRLLRSRSLLALLGIMVGSAAIVALLNIGRNAADESMRTFQAMGTDTLLVNFPYSPQASQPLPATLDTQAILKAVPSLAQVAPISLYGARVRYNSRSVDAEIVGATTGLAEINGLRLQQGRFISDFDHRATYVVVGAGIARKLSEKMNPLRPGDLLRIDNYLFTVIGIAESLPPNPLLPLALDDAVLIPLNGMGRVRPSPELSSVIVKIKAATDIFTAEMDLRHYLSSLLPGRSIEVQVPRQLLEGMRRQANMFTSLLGGLGGISLLVGGVGVMNVMLMSVAERRREIGVRMALGARRFDICMLFLLEAASLSIVGALLGVLLGITAISIFTLMSGWHFKLALGSLAIGGGSSVLIGIFFGIYPAVSASRFQPVQALRDE
jgi:putative ABC transport system permease protein